MAAGDWLETVKTEEQRLLGEIAKTDLFRQLEAVREVLAVYQGKDSSGTQAIGVMPKQNPETGRVWKAAS